MEMRTLRREDFDYIINMEPRWRDMDGLRHINHATYLSYLETVRIQYMEKLGYDVNDWDRKRSSILASMKIDYHQQSSFPNQYEIGARVIRIGNKSFDILNALFEHNNSVPVVTGVFTVVGFDYAAQETIPVSERIKKEYRPF